VLIMVFLGLAYCGYQGSHIAIELFYDKLSRPLARALDRLINLAGCLLFVIIAWRAVVQSLDVRDFGEASQLLLIPYFPFYWLLAFGALLFAWVMGLRVFVPEPEPQEERR
jgi:TRAP-type C4-dicarboxylate transport system permease small subunit